MRLDTRTLKALGGLVLVVVLGVLTTQLGGSTSDGGRDGGGGSSPAASATAPPSVDLETDLPWIDVGALPDEAVQVLDAVDAGGPFTYPGKDGSTFSNFEGVLPDQPRGWYREYTVPTPGSDDRGARRIVTGGPGPAAYFWTDDHYDTFSRIRR